MANPVKGAEVRSEMKELPARDRSEGERLPEGRAAELAVRDVVMLEPAPSAPDQGFVSRGAHPSDELLRAAREYKASATGDVSPDASLVTPAAELLGTIVDLVSAGMEVLGGGRASGGPAGEAAVAKAGRLEKKARQTGKAKEEVLAALPRYLEEQSGVDPHFNETKRFLEFGFYTDLMNVAGDFVVAAKAYRAAGDGEGAKRCLEEGKRIFEAARKAQPEALTRFDEASRQASKLKADGQEVPKEIQEIVDNSGLQSMAKQRDMMLEESPQFHELVSGNNPDGFVYKHLAAHMDSKPTLASKVDVKQFGDVSSLVGFAEGWLQKAHRGELEPGAEVPVSIARPGGKPLTGRLRLMKTGEMLDGAPIGESGPGKLSILRVTFDKPVGENTVVSLDDLAPGTPALTVDRKVGGREDRVKVVSGAHQASNQLVIIGGPYSSESFGLYTLYAGRYTMGYNPNDAASMAYWERHAYLSGDWRPLTEERHRGEVVNPDSTLQEMIGSGDVSIPQGSLSRERRGMTATSGRPVEVDGEGAVITAFEPHYPIAIEAGQQFAEFAGAKVHGPEEDVEVRFKLGDGAEEQSYRISFDAAIGLGFIDYDGQNVRPVAPDEAPKGHILIGR